MATARVMLCVQIYDQSSSEVSAAHGRLDDDKPVLSEVTPVVLFTVLGCRLTY